MKSTAKDYRALVEHVAQLPVIDTHDHADTRIAIKDILRYFTAGYFSHDLLAASSDADVALINDDTRPLMERWPTFEAAYRRAKYTGYGLHVRMALKKWAGTDAVSRETIEMLQRKLPDFSDPRVYDAFYDDAHIVARIVNIRPPDLTLVMKGSYRPRLPKQYMVIPLPEFHRITTRQVAPPLDIYWYRGEGIPSLEKTGTSAITSLDEYLHRCRELFEAFKRNGAVAFKDQSAYSRSLAFSNPTRHEAEVVFNRILADPRYGAEYDPQSNPLSDFLMHEFLRMARDMELPVQMHTGHMAGGRNDVTRANAAGLRSLIEIHRDVQFDLFHANWPYSSDILFLAKSYPNVAINFCWAYIIDPIYCRNTLVQAVSSVPHGKIHGFGSDVGGDQPDKAWAHCRIAVETIAAALADLVDMDYIGIDDAKQIAADWLFHNPNRFFKLGLTM